MTKKELEKTKKAIAEAKAGSNKEEIEKKIREVLQIQKSKATKSLDGLDKEGGLTHMITKSSADPKVIEFQKRSDDIYITSRLMGTSPRNLNIFKDFQSSEIMKALSTVMGAGGDWVPTGMSAELIDRISLELMVAALFDRIKMPTNPYILPMKTTGAQVYLLQEPTQEQEYEERHKATNVGTGRVVLSAEKLGARMEFSDELEEDSIIPILPMIKTEMVRAMKEAQEDTTINGDITGTLDADIIAQDPTLAWDGLRILANVSRNIGVITIEDLRCMRSLMGRYGVDPNKLALIVGTRTYMQLLGLKDSAGREVVTTVDKYGANATILKGELGKVDGYPVIVSEYCRDDVNTTGVYDGSVTNKGLIILVYRPGFIYGDRKAVTIKTGVDIKRNLNIVIVIQRLDFQPRLPATENTICLGYNVTIC